VLNDVMPKMIHNVLYSTWIQTKTAEHGSRRMAMETATDNAEELSEELLLKYNQARQAAITQEITEIVSGADAL
ncbi:MAG TPA: ATP synthase F1 subunit gamma, partial [Erysipelotrichaceae bacterium]|nr:ATP synthase F1 subunit gamma [Erysipelotrichaceae bacterium]